MRWRLALRTRAERRTGDRKKSEPSSAAVRLEAFSTSVTTTLPWASAAAAAAADARVVPGEARTRRALPRTDRRRGVVFGVACFGVSWAGVALFASAAGGVAAAAAWAKAELPSLPSVSTFTTAALAGLAAAATEAATPASPGPANKSSLSPNMSTSTPSPKQSSPASGDEASGDDAAGVFFARGVGTRAAGPSDRGVQARGVRGRTDRGAGAAQGLAGGAFAGTEAGSDGADAACFASPVGGTGAEAGCAAPGAALRFRLDRRAGTSDADVLLLPSHSAFSRDTVPVGMRGDGAAIADVMRGAEGAASACCGGALALGVGALGGGELEVGAATGAVLVLTTAWATEATGALAGSASGVAVAAGAASSAALDPRTRLDTFDKMALKLRRFASSGVGSDDTPLGVVVALAVFTASLAEGL